MVTIPIVSGGGGIEKLIFIGLSLIILLVGLFLKWVFSFKVFRSKDWENKL